MRRSCRITVAGLALALTLACATASAALAQGRGNSGRVPEAAGLTLSGELRSQIREFYAGRPVSGAEALPPGIRKNLERGKPLPPGIAKKVAPAELFSRLGLPEGFQLVEVGLDVLLLEVATNTIHDVLLDIIR